MNAFLIVFVSSLVFIILSFVLSVILIKKRKARFIVLAIIAAICIIVNATIYVFCSNTNSDWYTELRNNIMRNHTIVQNMEHIEKYPYLIVNCYVKKYDKNEIYAMYDVVKACLLSSKTRSHYLEINSSLYTEIDINFIINNDLNNCVSFSSYSVVNDNNNKEVLDNFKTWFIHDEYKD